MPGLLQYQYDVHGKDGVPLISAERPEGVDLKLPSQVPKESRQQIFVQGLPAIEEKLRTAQCHDALDTVPFQSHRPGGGQGDSVADIFTSATYHIW
jgi:hypothetical protein